MLYAVCSHVGYFHQDFCNLLQIRLYAMCSQGGVISQQIIIIYGVIVVSSQEVLFDSILFKGEVKKLHQTVETLSKLSVESSVTGDHELRVPSVTRLQQV